MPFQGTLVWLCAVRSVDKASLNRYISFFCPLKAKKMRKYCKRNDFYEHVRMKMDLEQPAKL